MGASITTTNHVEEIRRAEAEAVERALEAVGITAEGYAKLLCPVDTGRLRNSITHAVKTDEKAVYIGTNVSYAPYVEMGTTRSKAQPYLKPAIENHADEYKRLVERVLKGS